ncbi:MAG: histidine phosphatase family protein [Gemmataceae bacterium]|nr:histidine phosphatase family protein [Gemmataceae bacterium]
MRHAATAGNIRKPYTIQGLRPDSELCPEGAAQARAVRLPPLAAAYCSPLARARETARIVAGTAVEEPGLLEVDVGEWSGLTWAEIASRWPAEHAAFEADAERHGYHGGENLAQVRDRVLPCIERLAARHAGETVLAVSHGVVNRVLLSHWMGIPLRWARKLPQDNTGMNIIDWHDGAAKVRTVNA